MNGPMWNYYGGKWRAAPRYPAPLYGRIVEPFAGAAGYSMRYPHLDVMLIDSDEIIAGLWSYLIRVSADEIRRIPIVDHVDDLDGHPQEARWLVGFLLNTAVTQPCKSRSAWMKENAGKANSWSVPRRERIAQQVDLIRHWRVIHGIYADAPDVEATWFVDPPYQVAGKHYRHGASGIDFGALGEWCKQRRGQVMVCENAGADWLPFRHFADIKASTNNGKGGVSKEVIWTKGCMPLFPEGLHSPS